MSVPTPSSSGALSARSIGRLLGLGAATAGWLSAATVHQSLTAGPQKEAVFQGYMKRWASSLVRATGGRVELSAGSVVPPQRGARIVVSNHRSPFDIGVLLSLFGGYALSRKDLASWPVLGLAARRAGTIFVDRDDAGSGAQAIRTIRKKLVDGASILVFAEGGTFSGDDVRPFKPGAFAALRGLDVEIVPVGLAYDPGVEWVDETFVDHVLRVATRPVTRCVVSVGASRKAEGSTKALARMLRDEVHAQVGQARAHYHQTAR